MNRIVCLLVLVLGMLASSAELFATHNRAGEILYTHDPLPGETYRYAFTVVTYTKTGGESDDADRDSLDVDWGDLSFGVLPRTNNNGQGENLGNSIRKNIYRGHHTYAAPSMYVVTMNDPNRIDNIVNINFGTSENISFVLIDSLFILPEEFFGFNSSPVLEQPPIDVANSGFPFIHNPNAFDPDGDSLHFELVAPLELGTGGFSAVQNFQLPDEVIPGVNFLPPSGNLPPAAEYEMTIDPNSGEILWDSPWQTGIYNIAILIKEFRNGFLIGTMIRDMQIEVFEAENVPPVLPELQDTCVLVGEELILEVEATDSDNHFILLTATGSPLNPMLTENIASFQQDLVESEPGFSTGTFTWTPGCDEIFSTAYSVVVKAEDDFAELPLVDLATWNINVVAPSPTGLSSAIVGGNVQLFWDDDYVCQDSEEFLGFSVWRKIGCDDFILDECSEDLADLGYEQIAIQLMANTYTDTSAPAGLTYSYRITGDFTDIVTEGGVPLNFGYGLASFNTCETLPSDVPLITNVDVESTDAATGEILLRWTKPDPIKLDTLTNLPPYVYEVYRLENGVESLVQSFTAESFFAANDTAFVETGLNTLVQSHTYFVRFLSNGNLIGNSVSAESIFVNANPSDGRIELVWNEDVPWVNETYDIYRMDTGGTFEFVATTAEQFYLDFDLVNGEEYCYYVESSGSYLTEGILDPLINKSQEICSIAIDEVPPCDPTLFVTNDCNSPGNEWEFQNRLTWDSDCIDELEGYLIYYRSPGDSAFNLIETINDPTINQFTHELDNTISGCYLLTAFDLFQNESTGQEICIENCALYDLPNVFTPNSDGSNDVFMPLDGYRFVNRIDLKVYNRWGGLVFETEEPEINWDGTDSETGEELPTGVYFYVGRTIEGAENIQLTGLTFEGYIHLVRSE